MTQPKTRDQLARRDTWRLEDIFENEAAWEAQYASAQEKIELLTGYREKLGEPAALKAALETLFDASLMVGRLYCYARMRRDEDNAVTRYQALVDRAQALAVAFDTAGSYIAPELLSLEPQYLEKVRARAEFADYRVYLGEIARRRPHTLSAAEERIVAMAGEMAAAPDTVYSMLTDGDMRFKPVIAPSGEELPLTQSSFIPLMMNPEREVRRSAFMNLYEGFKNYSATIPAIYASSVKADQFGAATSNFSSALEAALFPDEVPVSVYENLIQSVRAHLKGLNRFVTLNARLIGLEKPAMYDLYVPVKQGFDLCLGFDEAYELVADCLGALGEDYQKVLRRAREERWIDPYPTQGKTSGAYSWGAYDTHPYVLLNYHEDLDGLLTIAHEMGHSLHTYLSNAAQPYPTSDYSLFVAEVASTVNEVLVLMELLERYPAREAQVYLLNNLLDSYRTTLFRQTMFAEFERDAHALSQSGEALTFDSLNALYRALNDAYYFSVERPDEISWEWMRIPHFYRAFYVYKYATGFSAAMALAAMIREEGAAAVARYKRFLSAGCSLSPLDALRLAGVDMGTGEPVDRALEQFERLLDRYEAALEMGK